MKNRLGTNHQIFGQIAKFGQVTKNTFGDYLATFGDLAKNFTKWLAKFWWDLASHQISSNKMFYITYRIFSKLCYFLIFNLWNFPKFMEKIGKRVWRMFQFRSFLKQLKNFTIIPQHFKTLFIRFWRINFQSFYFYPIIPIF